LSKYGVASINVACGGSKTSSLSLLVNVIMCIKCHGVKCRFICYSICM